MKKSQPALILSILVLLSMFLAGCTLPSAQQDTPTPVLVFTEPPTQPVIVPPTTPPIIVVTAVPPSPTTAVQPSPTETAAPTATPTPAVTATGAACTNQLTFVTDVTVPDNTEMSPGETFSKTWRVQNSGTCTWTNQYALVFVSGEQMNGTSPLPLPNNVAPGGTLDVSNNMKAPPTAGTYRGDWKLKSPNGTIFGSGSKADQPFFVQIKVVEAASELNLGAPTWVDNMDTSNNWYLLDTANTKFTEQTGKLVMTSLHAGGGDEWDLSNQPSMNDYYLQATFIVGSSGSGLDHYGLLARAPDSNAGYVFQFSLDGRYHLYTWDGKNYNAIQEWHSSSSILTGTGQTNIMGIWMEGTTIRLYANGHKIAEFTDSTYDHGQFGLTIGSVNTDNFSVAVDQVEYWKFDK